MCDERRLKIKMAARTSVRVQSLILLDKVDMSVCLSPAVAMNALEPVYLTLDDFVFSSIPVAHCSVVWNERAVLPTMDLLYKIGNLNRLHRRREGAPSDE